MRIFIITVICLALASPAFAGLYKWVDKDGKVHFTDSLSKVPLDQRNKKHIKKMKSSQGDANSPAAAAPAPRTETSWREKRRFRKQGHRS